MSRDEYVEAIERALEPVAMRHNLEITVSDETVTARMVIDRIEHATASQLGAPEQESIDKHVAHVTAWAEGLMARTGQ